MPPRPVNCTEVPVILIVSLPDVPLTVKELVPAPPLTMTVPVVGRPLELIVMLSLPLPALMVMEFARMLLRTSAPAPTLVRFEVEV